MLRKFFLCGGLGLSLFVYQNSAIAGCEQLIITVTNHTNYIFQANPSTLTANSAQGIYGSATSLPNITPHGNTVITITGSAVPNDSNHLDEVNAVLHYYATSNKGVQININAVKASCNGSSASCTEKKMGDCCNGKYRDDLGTCWAYLYPTCYETAASCGTATNNGTNSSNPIAANHNVYFSDPITNTSPSFTCSTTNVCKTNSGYDYVNNPYKGDAATTTFDVYPAILTQLVVTLPFNNQSPLAKVIQDAIYNNLKSTSLSVLTTFTTPVLVGSNTMTFSTLCNSPKCPGAVTA